MKRGLSTMPLDLGLFAKKLARYRQQFQADYEEVSQNTGIPREKLIALEQASLEPTGDDILILADYFKCDYKFFISNEMLAQFEQTETLFRMYGDDLSSEDRWAIQEFLFLCECEDYLLSQGSARPTHPFSFAKRGRYYKKQGVEAAGALRNHLGYRGSEVASNVYDDFRKEPENFSSFVRSTSVRCTFDINANQGLTSISGGSCTAQRVNYSQAQIGHSCLSEVSEEFKNLRVVHKAPDRGEMCPCEL